jgi:hypothetical protein
MIACAMQEELAAREKEFDSCHGAAYSANLYDRKL